MVVEAAGVVVVAMLVIEVEIAVEIITIIYSSISYYNRYRI